MDSSTSGPDGSSVVLTHCRPLQVMGIKLTGPDGSSIVLTLCRHLQVMGTKLTPLETEKGPDRCRQLR